MKAGNFLTERNMRLVQAGLAGLSLLGRCRSKQHRDELLKCLKLVVPLEDWEGIVSTWLDKWEARPANGSSGKPESQSLKEFTGSVLKHLQNGPDSDEHSRQKGASEKFKKLLSDRWNSWSAQPGAPSFSQLSQDDISTIREVSQKPDTSVGAAERLENQVRAYRAWWALRPKLVASLPQSATPLNVTEIGKLKSLHDRQRREFQRQGDQLRQWAEKERYKPRPLRQSTAVIEYLGVCSDNSDAIKRQLDKVLNDTLAALQRDPFERVDEYFQNVENFSASLKALAEIQPSIEIEVLTSEVLKSFQKRPTRDTESSPLDERFPRPREVELHALTVDAALRRPATGRNQDLRQRLCDLSGIGTIVPIGEFADLLEHFPKMDWLTHIDTGCGGSLPRRGVVIRTDNGECLAVRRLETGFTREQFEIAEWNSLFETAGVLIQEFRRAGCHSAIESMRACLRQYESLSALKPGEPQAAVDLEKLVSTAVTVGVHMWLAIVENRDCQTLVEAVNHFRNAMKEAPWAVDLRFGGDGGGSGLPPRWELFDHESDLLIEKTIVATFSDGTEAFRRTRLCVCVPKAQLELGRLLQRSPDLVSSITGKSKWERLAEFQAQLRKCLRSTDEATSRRHTFALLNAALNWSLEPDPAPLKELRELAAQLFSWLQTQGTSLAPGAIDGESALEWLDGNPEIPVTWRVHPDQAIAGQKSRYRVEVSRCVQVGDQDRDAAVELTIFALPSSREIEALCGLNVASLDELKQEAIKDLLRSGVLSQASRKKIGQALSGSGNLASELASPQSGLARLLMEFRLAKEGVDDRLDQLDQLRQYVSTDVSSTRDFIVEGNLKGLVAEVLIPYLESLEKELEKGRGGQPSIDVDEFRFRLNHCSDILGEDYPLSPGDVQSIAGEVAPAFLANGSPVDVAVTFHDSIPRDSVWVHKFGISGFRPPVLFRSAGPEPAECRAVREFLTELANDCQVPEENFRHVVKDWPLFALKSTPERKDWCLETLLEDLKDSLTSTTVNNLSPAAQIAIGKRYRTLIEQLSEWTLREFRLSLWFLSETRERGPLWARSFSLEDGETWPDGIECVCLQPAVMNVDEDRPVQMGKIRLFRKRG